MDKILTDGWTADQVWAAAVRASRINNDEYLRNDEWVPDPQNPEEAKLGRKANRYWINEGLTNVWLLEAQDYEDGRQARAYFQKQYTFRVLRQDLNGFEQRMAKTLGIEQFYPSMSTEYSVIASQIPRWRASCIEQEILKDAVATPLATVGERIQRQVTVARAVYSEKYNMNFLTGRTNCGHRVMFGYKTKLELGRTYSIQGTVKEHRSDCTQLNRVKLFDL